MKKVDILQMFFSQTKLDMRLLLIDLFILQAFSLDRVEILSRILELFPMRGLYLDINVKHLAAHTLYRLIRTW